MPKVTVYMLLQEEEGNMKYIRMLCARWNEIWFLAETTSLRQEREGSDRRTRNGGMIVEEGSEYTPPPPPPPI